MTRCREREFVLMSISRFSHCELDVHLVELGSSCLPSKLLVPDSKPGVHQSLYDEAWRPMIATAGRCTQKCGDSDLVRLRPFSRIRHLLRQNPRNPLTHAATLLLSASETPIRPHVIADAVGIKISQCLGFGSMSPSSASLPRRCSGTRPQIFNRSQQPEPTQKLPGRNTSASVAVPDTIAARFHFSGQLEASSAKKYLAWEVAVNLHRSNPDAIVILGDSNAHAADAADFDLDSVPVAGLLSHAQVVRRDGGRGNASYARQLRPASLSGVFDIAVLSGLGPVAGAVLLLWIARLAHGRRARVLLYSRPRKGNTWQPEDEAFFRVPARRYAVACNTFHAFNLRRMRALVGARADDIVEGAIGYLASRFGRQPSRVQLLGSKKTRAPSSPYALQMAAANARLKHPIALVGKSGALNTAAWKSVTAVNKGEYAKASALLLQALDAARRAGYAAVVLGCTEYSVAAHFAIERNASSLDRDVVVDPLAILARRVLGCGWRFSHARGVDVCECESPGHCASVTAGVAQSR